MDSEWLEKQYKREEDIISRMPDDVLSHIISRLDAKDAVKTCVLSTRWKNVWTLIYNFCFNNLATDGDVLHRRTLFVNFVELVIRRSRSKSIQKFLLKTRFGGFQESDAARLIELICWTVDHNVCSLTFKSLFAIRIPQSILTCKSLVKLSLGFKDFVLDIPDCTVCFSCLKFLSIYINSPNCNSLQKLFHSCPILEELKIKGLIDENVLTIDINVPTLKKLKIHLVIDYGYANILEHRFVVRASNLEYLDLYDDYLSSFVVGETPFLNKVILGDDVILRLLTESPEDEATTRAIEFFRAISSTRLLSLVIKYYKELSPLLDGNLPFFPNLTCLDLGFDHLFGSALLVEFFNNSPNLEVLNLEIIVFEEVEESWYNIRSELDYIPSCMLLHLKEIYLLSVESYLEGVIKWLLENSKVLERFSVYIDPSTDEQEIQNRILNFPRASPICEIEFVDHSCKEKRRSKFNKYRESYTMLAGEYDVKF